MSIKLKEREQLQKLNESLNNQLGWCEVELEQKQDIIIDFVNKEVRYKKNDSLRVAQMEDQQQLIKLEKKKGRRDKWIYGGVGLGVGILTGLLIGILAK